MKLYAALRLMVGCAAIAGLMGCSKVENDAAPKAKAAQSATHASASVAASTDGASAVSLSNSNGHDGESSAFADARSNGARKVSADTELFRFEYTYPAKAGQIASLDRMLDEDLQTKKREAEREARISRAIAREDGSAFRKHSYEMIWLEAGDVAALSQFAGRHRDLWRRGAWQLFSRYDDLGPANGHCAETDRSVRVRCRVVGCDAGPLLRGAEKCAQGEGRNAIRELGISGMP